MNRCGVKEGSSYKYDSKDAEFTYCNYLIDLYRIEGQQELKFMDFQQHHQDYEGCSPRDLQFLDSRIVKSLVEQNIVTMRPVQIATLQAAFFQNPPGIQRQADFMGISTTGSGKTHAYLIPIAQKCLSAHKESFPNSPVTPLALIFSHSVPLAENIYEKLTRLLQHSDVKVRLIAGGHPPLESSAFHIGVCTIGKFFDHIISTSSGVNLFLLNVKYVVIDEADQMCETREFEHVYGLLKQLADFSTMLFSATYRPSIMSFIDESNYYTFRYGDPNAVSISVKQHFWHVNSRCNTQIFGVLRDNVVVDVYGDDEKPHPFDAIYCFLAKEFKEKKSDIRVLIFAKRTFTAQIIAQRLSLYGILTYPVLSTLKFEERQQKFESFANGEFKVMTATNLLTRGTDIEVDYVINYDLPLEYSAYIHRCGRTGRNQCKGVAITCVDFENHDDYSPSVLQKIAIHTKKLRGFMKKYAENVRKMQELEQENQENVA